MLDKADIRKTILTQRNSLTQDFVQKNSQIIIEKLLGLEEFKNSKVIMCYVSAKNEVDTTGLIKTCLSIGKLVLVPCTSGLDMLAVMIKGIEELKEGRFGILEPELHEGNALEPHEIDLVVVPGVAFDKNLNRVGHGLGYYDKFLRRIRSDCIKVGLAYDFQVVTYDEIFTEDFDVAVDMVISEKQIYRS